MTYFCEIVNRHRSHIDQAKGLFGAYPWAFSSVNVLCLRTFLCVCGSCEYLSPTYRYLLTAPLSSTLRYLYLCEYPFPVSTYPCIPSIFLVHSQTLIFQHLSLVDNSNYLRHEPEILEWDESDLRVEGLTGHNGKYWPQILSQYSLRGMSGLFLYIAPLQQLD